ncbi:hypothetical protein QL285_051982 [Trifolium repens]|nr:hypothetical protein QL285_051982 [Trifolium repens]
MNPYDFYSLDDFLEFSTLSPNYANLNMVSSPRFRSPRVRSASAIVPLPEDSSIAYHKEIYTVLFDPTSFVMVHSIVCHLWKKSKLEKKFLPLPLLRKSPQDSSILIQNPLSDSISEEEGEISTATSSVIESVTANQHRISTAATTCGDFNIIFGSFHHTILDSKPLAPIIAHEIDSSAIKIGEIKCFITSENSQSITSKNKVQIEKVEEFVKMSNPGSQSSFFIADISFEEITKLIKPFPESMDLVEDSRRNYYDIVVKTYLLSFASNTVLAVETVFDPGGVVKPLSAATFGGMITLTPSLLLLFRLVIVFSIEFADEFSVTVFDPGGDRHYFPSYNLGSLSVVVPWIDFCLVFVSKLILRFSYYEFEGGYYNIEFWFYNIVQV